MEGGWSVPAGQQVEVEEHEEIVERVAAIVFSPDGRMLASGGHDAKLILWDIATRSKLATWEG
jgi:WD40 repeat protein